MPITYRKWFGIDCLHDYFSDRLCRVLTLRPTLECRHLLERYGCLFRPTEGGGAVYYGDSDDTSLLQDYAETRPLGFTLTSTDPWLETYTDIEPAGARASPARSCYYFNNMQCNVDANGGREHLLLHPPGEALAKGPMVVKPSAFAYDFDAPLRQATLSVIDSIRQRAIWETTTSNDEASSWNLNLTGVPSGRYNLNVNGKVAFEFYLFDQSPVKYWGLVEIFPGGPGMSGLISEQCRLIEPSGEPRPRDFAVSMGTRQTTWRYHITSNSPDQQSYDDFTVIGTRRNASRKDTRQSRDIPFTRVQPSPGSSEDTLLFESKQEIPLRQIPSGEHVFSFKPEGASANGNAELKLPYAMARNSRVESASGNRRMVSDIYVYL